MTLARRPPPFASAALVVLLCAALPPACSSLPVVYRTKNGPGDGATRQHNASLMAYLRTFPNPRTQVRMCGGGGGAFRAGNAPVCDPSGTLTRRERELTSRLFKVVLSILEIFCSKRVLGCYCHPDYVCRLVPACQLGEHYAARKCKQHFEACLQFLTSKCLLTQICQPYESNKLE